MAHVKNNNSDLIGLKGKDLYNYLHRTGYWAYRFDKASNYIDFRTWVKNKVKEMEGGN